MLPDNLATCSASRLLLFVIGLSRSFCGFSKLALALCFFDTRIAINQSCDRPCHHSRDDLDRNANRETKLAVSAPLIKRDFNKPV